jgi:hypothetical protein
VNTQLRGWLEQVVSLIGIKLYTEHAQPVSKNKIEVSSDNECGHVGTTLAEILKSPFHTFSYYTKPAVQQISAKSNSDLKCLRARRVTRSKFHTEDPKILVNTVQNLVTQDFCTPALNYFHSRLLVGGNE